MKVEFRVYFIEATVPEHGLLIKIGYGRDVQARYFSIKSYYPDAKLLASAPGGIEMEAVLHHVFAPVRVKGEWFKPSLKIRRLAEYCAIVGALPSPFTDAAIARETAASARQAEQRALSSANTAVRGLDSKVLRPGMIVKTVARGVERALASGWRP